MITGKNQIGNTLSATGTITFTTYNPELDRENDVVFTEATQKEIEQALSLATDAFKEFRNVSGKKKAEFLNAIADEILALDDTLVKTYCFETGLPEGRAKGEKGRTVGQLRSFANLVEEGSWVEATIDKAQPNREPMPKADITENEYSFRTSCGFWCK
jgi:alpha-ketoglutaric semialdehyde dehydrogenase